MADDYLVKKVNELPDTDTITGDNYLLVNTTTGLEKIAFNDLQDTIIEGMDAQVSNVVSEGTTSTKESFQVVKDKEDALEASVTSINSQLQTLQDKTNSMLFVSAEDTNSAGFHNSIFRGKRLGREWTTTDSGTYELATNDDGTQTYTSNGGPSTYELTCINNGSFTDMYVGDYWDITSTTTSGTTTTTTTMRFRIAGFNLLPHLISGNHVIVVPDKNITGSNWTKLPMYKSSVDYTSFYDSSLFAKGVDASDLYTSDKKAVAVGYGKSTLLTKYVNGEVLNTIKNYFPSDILKSFTYTVPTVLNAELEINKKKKLSSNGKVVKTKDGKVVYEVIKTVDADGTFQSETVTQPIALMTQLQVFGAEILTTINSSHTRTSHNILTNEPEFRSQFPLFRLAPEFMDSGSAYWLSNMFGAKSFMYVSGSYGRISYGTYDKELGIRPFFAIGSDS